MKNLLLAVSFLISASAFAAFDFNNNVGTSEESEETVQMKPKPSLGIEVSPVSLLAQAYNLTLQFPITSKFTIGPKVSLFRMNSGNSEKQGSQIGVRTQYFLNRTWRETGVFIKTGLFYDNYRYRGDMFGTNDSSSGPWKRNGETKGLMIDLMLAAQIDINPTLALTFGGGVESNHWINYNQDDSFTGDSLTFDRATGRRLEAVIEFTANIAI